MADRSLLRIIIRRMKIRLEYFQLVHHLAIGIQFLVLNNK